MRQDIGNWVPEVLAALRAQAVAGDVAAAKLLLERALPPLRPQDTPVPLPLGADLGQAGKAVLSGLEDGTLTPDEAAKLAGVIGALARSNELVEIERRLSSIEGLLNERQTR